MEEEERKKKIRKIMSEVKGRREYTSIPIEAWLLPEDSEEWKKYCRMVVDSYEDETGEKDTDSGFAQCLRH